MTGHSPPLVTNTFDIVLVLFVVSIYLSTLLHASNLGSKQFNHLLSYLVVTGIFYFGAKLLLRVCRISYDEIMGWLTAAVLIAALFGLVEFSGKNFFGFNVDGFVPRPSGATYPSTFAATVVRSRSFMSESANFASFLDMFTPIIVVHWWTKGRRSWSFVILAVVVSALVTTFSAAAVVAVGAGVFCLGVLYVSRLISGRGLRGILPVGLLAGVVIVGVSIMIVHREADWSGGIIDKILFLNESSAGDRLQRWTSALEMVGRSPCFGSGAGSFLRASQVGEGIVSWPIQVLAEGGFVAGMLLATLFLLLLRRVIRFPDSRRYAYLMGLIACIVHYSVISDYWMPWIWFLPLLVYMVPVGGRSSARVAGDQTWAYSGIESSIWPKG